ncbi:MAG: hypothetical protein R3B92_00160 [Patescibacteria group bacterium]
MYFLRYFAKNIGQIDLLKIVLFSILLVCTVYLRITDLGYADFYGDETKVLFLRKDVSASDFLLNQRKGPGQFMIAWLVEKATGGYNEAYLRLPFALAGTIAVLVLFWLVYLMFDYYTALFAATLFSLNGFFIAFSRTLQYQSFVILLGLISVTFAYLYYDSFKELDSTLNTNILNFTKLFVLDLSFGSIRLFYLLVSALFLAAGVLFHYDALIFFIPAAYFVLIPVYKFYFTNKIYFKRVLIYALIFCGVFLFGISLFYVSYIFGGYFLTHTYNYLAKRISGAGYVYDNGFNTHSLYNSVISLFILYSFSVYAAFDWDNIKVRALLLWFLIPFLFLEILVSNPGTHVYLYVVPLVILAGYGINNVYINILGARIRRVFLSILVTLVTLVFFYNVTLFIPMYSSGYPWKTSLFGPFLLPKPDHDSHVFVYGFPYNRGWKKTHEYFEKNGMPRSFYTNDNVTIGEYYLFGSPAEIPRIDRGEFPQYFIEVLDSQEYTPADRELLQYYDPEAYVFVKNTTVTTIYKLKPGIVKPSVY